MKQLLYKYPHVLAFGVLQIFFSAPGQTFLIGLFILPITKDLGISETLLATVYSTATLTASLLLNPAGRLIDRLPVPVIVRRITWLMTLGCWVLAAANNIYVLFAGFFLLRLIGQGVFGLAASTLIVKSFQRNRGKAMGLVTLGFPLSEAVYPFVGMLLLNSVGWRTSYVIFGLTYLLIMRFVQLFLINRADLPARGRFYPEEEYYNSQQMHDLNRHPHIMIPEKEFTLSEVMRDVKFYLLLMANCLPPLVVTALFYHQQSVFDAHGWPFFWVTYGLLLYAVCKAIGSVWMGIIVDRIGALIPFVIMILMLGTGAFLAGIGGPAIVSFFYFTVIGTALGFSSPVMNVVWPQFYGTRHMGSIKGFIATFRNGLTALGPLPIALALDHGVSVRTVLMGTGVVVMMMAVLPIVAWRLAGKKSQRA